MSVSEILKELKETIVQGELEKTIGAVIEGNTQIDLARLPYYPHGYRGIHG